MKATPFKIVEVIDANTTISTETKKIIEQNNFVNNSLHIIGQQLDHIEKKVEKPTISKPGKPLIDLPSQRENLSLKTSRDKTIEKVEQMFFNLQKIKTEQGTSTNTAHAISRKKREILFSLKMQDLTLHPLLLIKLFLNY